MLENYNIPIFILRKYNFFWARENFLKLWLEKFGTWPNKGSPPLNYTFILEFTTVYSVYMIEDKHVNCKIL